MAGEFWLFDRQWRSLEPLLPTNQPGARRTDDRRVISGIVHMLRNGGRWQDCPACYGPATTIYNRYHRWSGRGIWQGMLAALIEATPGGMQLIDSTTAGQRGDAPPARALLAAVPAPAFCLANAAYDSDALRGFMKGRVTEPVIPNNPTRKRIHPFDRSRYKHRNVIERTIGRLKDWRRIHNRYDKLARNFASAVAIAASLHGWC